MQTQHSQAFSSQMDSFLQHQNAVFDDMADYDQQFLGKKHGHITSQSTYPVLDILFQTATFP
jgi:hypothetical protein